MVSESVPACALQDHLPAQLRGNKKAEASVPIGFGDCLKRDVRCYGLVLEAPLAAKDNLCSWK